MTWFAAHIVIGMKKKNGKNSPITIYENIILIEAGNFEEAQTKAMLIGKEEEKIEDGLTIDEVPAIRIFAGIRKILTISNPVNIPSQSETPPVNGTEISYSVYEVDDEKTLKAFANGETVFLNYQE